MLSGGFRGLRSAMHVARARGRPTCRQVRLGARKESAVKELGHRLLIFRQSLGLYLLREEPTRRPSRAREGETKVFIFLSEGKGANREWASEFLVSRERQKPGAQSCRSLLFRFEKIK
jgi:hypothetical protein